ncbi:MAG: DUF362 domain-containing protein [Candidatus Omnitrophota bacterium]|jgi:uncharacterized protein (DUF362 family)/Pyruvate/2-oxoacid:ferredoxin oxidoreductase delta subunit
MNASVVITRCPDYEPASVLAAVKSSLFLLGGPERYVKPQSRVLVKPNLLLAKGPECGVTTHPELVRAVIRVLKEIGCRVWVGDGPSVWNNCPEEIEEVYNVSGIKRVCDEEGASLVEFDRRRWHGRFPMAAFLDECDYLVSVPKFKTHGLTVLTGAIKNNFGLVSGSYKFELHRRHIDYWDFSEVVVDVYRHAAPALSIVDGITAMEGDGPGTSGQLRRQGLIVAGADAVAVDSVLASIMGLKPLDIPTTRVAAEKRLGNADLNTISIVGEKLAEVTREPFRLPKSSLQRRMPSPLLRLAGKLVRFYPVIDQERCLRCGRCVSICPEKAIQSNNEKITVHYRQCISCFCCQEICPAAAIKVRKSLLAEILGL